MRENDERLCGRETVQDLDAFAGRRPERAAKIIGGVDNDATLNNRRSQGVRLGAGIAGRLGRLWERFAICLTEVLSRDSATRSWRRRPIARATFVGPESEVPVETRFEQDDTYVQER